MESWLTCLWGLKGVTNKKSGNSFSEFVKPKLRFPTLSFKKTQTEPKVQIQQKELFSSQFLFSNEILVGIFQYLDFKTLIQCSKVSKVFSFLTRNFCKSWYELFQSSVVWKVSFGNQFGGESLFEQVHDDEALYWKSELLGTSLVESLQGCY